MSIVRKIKETISRISQRALGLDGIRFQLQVALERLEKLDTMQATLGAMANEIDAITAEVDVLRAHLEATETENHLTVSTDPPGAPQARENGRSEAHGPARAESEANGSTPEGTTLLVTHAELCGRHGTGALLLKLLSNERSLAVFYSHDFFKTHDTDAPAFHIVHSGKLFHNGARLVRNLLTNKRVRRILCVPFYKDDVQTALTAQVYTGAPLALYIMDDQNIHVSEIPDEMMGRLIQGAKICFAISPALCAAYEQKYQRRFWLAPPTADPDLFVPADYHFTPNTPPRGLLVGNVWSSQILNRFRETIRLSGLQIDWCGNAGKPFVDLDPEEMSKEGIFLKSHLPEPTLIELARAEDYAVIPGGALDGTDTHEWLARASLPSRMVYLMATANLPLIVMGHVKTAAAQFVTNLGLGRVCDYSASSFQDAVREVTDPTTSARIRARAQSLSPAFSTRDLSNWLWESMDKGQAVDQRFEALILRDSVLASPA
jgi:hypothetical protein